MVPKSFPGISTSQLALSWPLDGLRNLACPAQAASTAPNIHMVPIISTCLASTQASARATVKIHKYFHRTERVRPFLDRPDILAMLSVHFASKIMCVLLLTNHPPWTIRDWVCAARYSGIKNSGPFRSCFANFFLEDWICVIHSQLSFLIII